MWKAEGALQFATNLSLPGGFLLASTGNQYCDVTTSTGEYSCLQVPTLELPANLHKVSQCSGKAPIKAFSLLKAHTSAFTLKNLLRHFAKCVFIHRMQRAGSGLLQAL